MLGISIYRNNNRHLARKYARIFVCGHYLFREANIFQRAKLDENCKRRGADNFQEQISMHIFEAKWRLLCSLSFKYFFHKVSLLGRVGQAFKGGEPKLQGTTRLLQRKSPNLHNLGSWTPVCIKVCIACVADGLNRRRLSPSATRAKFAVFVRFAFPLNISNHAHIWCVT